MACKYRWIAEEKLSTEAALEGVKPRKYGSNDKDHLIACVLTRRGVWIITRGDGSRFIHKEELVTHCLVA